MIIPRIIIGVAISWGQSWSKAVLIFLKNPMNKNQGSSQCDSDPEHALQIIELESDESIANESDSSPCCDQEISSKGSKEFEKLKLRSKSLRDITDGTYGILTKIEHDHGALKKISKELVDKVHQQLEEIKQNNETQFRQIVDKNNEQYKGTEKRLGKNIKEIQEAIKLQHRETRRRFERLENKTNAGYFN